ncbi:MAG: hypothetical protein J07HX5_00034 [halophilic archaeon J07HX5]|nr:MAG: hypothetical protein J07HX5_00034 [halophilic archaeon J07HX5]
MTEFLAPLIHYLPSLKPDNGVPVEYNEGTGAATRSGDTVTERSVTETSGAPMSVCDWRQIRTGFFET